MEGKTVRRSLVRAGWRRIHYGAWAEPGREIDLGLRVRAIQLVDPELVASHRAAAALWGIELLGVRELDRVPPEFTNERWGSGTSRDGKVHRAALRPEEVTTLRPATAPAPRLTTPARTLADLLRSEGRDEALVAVDSALTCRQRRAPLVTLAQLTAAVDALPPRGRAEVRSRLALADPKCESPAETVARLRFQDAGLHPESQVELDVAGGRRVRVDFLFRAKRVVVEIEGYAFHGSRAAHDRDVARFNALQSCPEVALVLRFTAVEVFAAPELVIARIREALRSAA
ncbi:endonuclease domain-containing protein [Streptomyces sp. NBC_01304]|uniref:endonuclease domain-containing protein n=1 Tax=Streptomyces sp. NBC_01304 TaxID=2903818 RepID=UPI002E10BE15|nr:DUF559 domain-containing protein [Streptomyces sp. NBC_01304]